MELRIVGTELELAGFLKNLGNSNNLNKVVMVDENKSEATNVTRKYKKAKSRYVDTKYLANKYGLTTQAIRMYAKEQGMPHKIAKNKSYQYDEVEACEWIDNYIATHVNKTRGMKYNTNKSKPSAIPKMEIKKPIVISDYTKWRRNITDICRKSGIDEGKLLSQTYKYMTKNYGIVWEQSNKDFYQKNGRKPMSTLETAYSLEQSNKAYAKLLEGCLDTVIKSMKGVTV